ncbi:hypothetical protein Fot_42062 [Forsythia ovata]|uniref:Uncharacterized protein n=1 Tax=Forsythia ovata TaxID=205694 RepID=A0ABD1RK42_9LAMI
MSTAQSHVHNCELYKVLGMKIDELRSTVMGAEDIKALRSEKKILHSRFTISEDARAQAEFKIIKYETIQRLSVSVRKKAELKLKVCEDMAYTKHKQLAEALVEVANAKELLTKLRIPGYTKSKGSAETRYIISIKFKNFQVMTLSSQLCKQKEQDSEGVWFAANSFNSLGKDSMRIQVNKESMAARKYGSQ